MDENYLKNQQSCENRFFVNNSKAIALIKKITEKSCRYLKNLLICLYDNYRYLSYFSRYMEKTDENRVL